LALTRRRSNLLTAGRNLPRLDDAARHHLRIEAKRLRYAAEAFAPLHDEPAAKGFIAALKELQDHLGALNDAVGLQDLLTGLPLEGPALFAAGRLVGEAASDKARQVKQAAAAMEAFVVQAPFWERSAT
jgi:CHAD domain-containing protein